MRISIIIKTMMVVGGLAFIAPNVTADVSVTFSETLNEKMARINAIELRREKRFRKHGVESFGNANSTRLKFQAKRYSGTEWGNERAIPNLEDFSVENLIAAMFERGIREAAPEFEGNLHVHVDKLKVENFSLATLQSFSTQMKGSITVRNKNGDLLGKHRVSTGIVPKYVTTKRYKGPGYAFRDMYVDTRIGPIAAEFSQKALQKMFPDYEAPGLVVVLQH